MRLAEEHKVDITLLLKSAIDSEDFIVLYQPQIDVATSEVVGYEALVRLRNDKYSPEQFIPIAEENGQIVELDRIVTKKVVQRLATWKKRKQRIRPISINFSYEQLCDEEYLSYLTSLLDEYGVARKLIRVDVRESLFVNDGERARSFVDKLYKAGFGVAIDGFGAGYASIPHVMRIPVDAVKFDRALTEVFLAGGANEDVIASLVSLAHEAHKLVVIEGVETIQQLKMCRNMGCDVVQGFFFSEPLLPERVLRYNPPKIPFLVGEPTHPQLKDGHTPSQSVSEPVCSQPESESSRLRPESGVVHSQPGSKPACSQPGNEPTHQQAEGVTHQGEPGQKS